MPQTTERLPAAGLGARAAGGSRKTAQAPPLPGRHTCLPLGPPICSAQKAGWGGGGSLITRNQSLGLGRRNTPQIRGTTQSVVHGTRTQVLRKVMCTHTGTHTWAHKEGCEQPSTHIHREGGLCTHMHKEGHGHTQLCILRTYSPGG